MSRADVQGSFSSGVSERTIKSLLSSAFYADDWRWVQDHCLNFLSDPDHDVREVQQQSDGSFAVIVAEGGFLPGVEGFENSAGLTEIGPVPFPDYIVTAHELFAETYKYTPAGIKEGLIHGTREESDRVIQIENGIEIFMDCPIEREGTTLLTSLWK